MLDLGNAGERLFVSSPPVVFPALGGGRQIERGKINHTVDAKRRLNLVRGAADDVR